MHTGKLSELMATVVSFRFSESVRVAAAQLILLVKASATGGKLTFQNNFSGLALTSCCIPGRFVDGWLAFRLLQSVYVNSHIVFAGSKFSDFSKISTRK